MATKELTVKTAPFEAFEDGIAGNIEIRRDEDEDMWKSRTFSLFEDFRNPEVYRAAFIEFITSASYVFLSLATVITALQSNFDSNLAAIAVVHVLLIAFFISSALPASGGHFNPILTLTSLLTGHASFPRTILYIAFQMAGAILGAEALKSVLHTNVAHKYSLGGCLMRQNIDIDGTPSLSGVNDKQGFISEFIFSFVYLHINYAMGLDPKQQPIYGPVLGPGFTGILVGMLIFISGNLQPGYGGAGFNPARCLGPVVAYHSEQPYLWQQYWVFLIAPFSACLLEAAVYHLVPFDHSTLYKTKDSTIQVALKVISKKEYLSGRHLSSRSRSIHET